MWAQLQVVQVERIEAVQRATSAQFICARAGVRILATVIGFIFLLPLIACPATFAADQAKRITLVHSFGRDFKPWSEYARAIREELQRQTRWPVDIMDQLLSSARVSGGNPEGPFISYLEQLYVANPLDLIITVGAPAANFFQRNRATLFPGTPLLMAAVNQRRILTSALTENDTVVAVNNDHLAAFEIMLQVLPATRQVMVVIGNSPSEKILRVALERELKPLEGRIKLEWTDNLSFDELLKSAATLPPHSAIYWYNLSVDAAGVAHEGDKPLTRVHAVANAPIFSYDDSYFGRELLGGPMQSVAEGSRQIASVAVRILGGEKAGDIKTPASQFSTPKYDWRELHRWGISESLLPPGSQVLFREPSLWQQYFWTMVAILAALAVQSALIIALFWEDRRRRRSEANAQVLMVGLAHTNRIATAGQLTASIAHEIRQPLASIASFSSAGLNWLKRQPPNVEEVRSGLENIINQVHRVDDVIKSVNALFKNESTARTEVNLNTLVRQVLTSTARAVVFNGIVLETNFADNPSPYVMANPGQLQQVILNLITNAIEAMSASEHGARTLRIETSIDRTDSVVITVADSGPGFDAKTAGQLFQPFFTTKSSGMGLGLPICKSIIEAHGGHLTVASQAPRGAVFRVELPYHRHE